LVLESTKILKDLLPDWMTAENKKDTHSLIDMLEFMRKN